MKLVWINYETSKNLRTEKCLTLLLQRSSSLIPLTNLPNRLFFLLFTFSFIPPFIPKHTLEYFLITKKIFSNSLYPLHQVFSLFYKKDFLHLYGSSNDLVDHQELAQDDHLSYE